jgi:hypothetical protein
MPEPFHSIAAHCTVMATLVEVVTVELEESTPVNVKLSVPAVVAGVLKPPEPLPARPEPEFELPPPPHPIAPVATTIQSNASIAIQRRDEQEIQSGVARP